MEYYSKKRKTLARLFSQISEREKEVIISRYGLFGEKSETLEQIAKRYGLTRERVRQIQSKALSKLRRKYLCPISPNNIPTFFTEVDNQRGMYLFSADICRMKYLKIEVDNIKLFLESDSYKNFMKIKKYTRYLPNSMPYNEKITEILKFGYTLEIPEGLIKKFLNEFKSKLNKTEQVAVILENAGYPMHFTEVYNILSKSCDIGLERNVLAIMQRREDLFVRVTNGVYTIKSKENPESVPFIKNLIIEYLNQYKEGTPMQIYNFVINKRQCAYSSISMYLTTNDQFEEIKKGVYSLRNLAKNMNKHSCLDNMIDTLFKETEQIPMSEFIGVVQREMPEISMTALYEYLSSKSEISVQDNFILKK